MPTVQLENEAVQASILDTFVTVDLETTGLNPNEAEIIAVGAVRVESGSVTDTFHTYVRAEAGIPEETRRLTGITPGMLEGAPGPRSALTDLQEFAAHHIEYHQRAAAAAAGLRRPHVGEHFDRAIAIEIDFAEPFRSRSKRPVGLIDPRNRRLQFGTALFLLGRGEGRGCKEQESKFPHAGILPSFPAIVTRSRVPGGVQTRRRPAPPPEPGACCCRFFSGQSFAW